MDMNRIEEKKAVSVNTQNPLHTIGQLFEQQITNIEDGKFKSDWGVQETFEEFFKENPDKLLQVPFLTLKKLRCGQIPPNSLVRYVGMVQDIFDLEFYGGIYEEVNINSGSRKLATCKYTDSVPLKAGVEVDFDGPRSKTLDRLPLYCTAIPCLSEWAKVYEQQDTDQEPITASDTVLDGEAPNKRPLDEENIDLMEQDSTVQMTDSFLTSGGLSAKAKVGTSLPNKKQAISGLSSDINNQTVEGAGSNKELDCLVKVYNGATDNTFRVNEAVEFLGILSIDPSPPMQPISQDGDKSALPNDAMDTEMQIEHAARNPPTSAVPRLHCISYKKLPHSWPVELTSSEDPLLSLVHAPHTYNGAIRQLRDSLLNHFTQIFQGDRLAGEYCLLSLISTVHTRVDDLALGSLSVNFSNALPTDVLAIEQALRQLWPKCSLNTLDISSLNSGVFLPKKDYERNRLCYCPLQLTNETVLLLDETQMQEGQLNAVGVKSLEALQLLISHQKMPYDFQFYQMQYEVNHPVLLFSANKGLIKASCHIKWTKNADSEVSNKDETEANFERWRYFLAAAKSLNSKFTIGEDISKLAEDHFVEARRRSPEQVQAQDFHRWLTLARLVSLSYGETVMSREHWMHALELEKLAASREEFTNRSNRASHHGAHLFNEYKSSPSSVMTDISKS